MNTTSEVLELLTQRQSGFHDFLLAGSDLHVVEDNGTWALNIVGVVFAPSVIVQKQIAAYSGVPVKVMERMYEHSKSTFVETINTLLHEHVGEKGFCARTDGVHEAHSIFKGTSMKPMSHSEALRVVLDFLGPAADEVKIEDYTINDGELLLSLTIGSQQVTLSSEVGDIIECGYLLTNNDLSNQNNNVPRAQARTVYLACTNGQVTEELPGATAGMVGAKRFLHDDTGKVWQGLRADLTMGRAIMEALPGYAEKAKEVSVHRCQEVVPLLMKEFRVPEDLEGVILTEFQGNGDKMSKWEFVNRWTAAARNCEDRGSQVMLECIGGALLTIPIERLNLDEQEEKPRFRKLIFTE